MTVVDLRDKVRRSANVEVAVEVDREGVLDAIREAVASVGRAD
jgi:inosine-uridine nucleoside N-ribohydrolase